MCALPADYVPPAPVEQYASVPIAHAEELAVKTFTFEESIEYIRAEAVKADVDPDKAEYIWMHEGRGNLTARGDLEPMKDGIPAYARGGWQITRKFHPEVSDECADDLVCSTKQALPMVRDRCLQEFSTCRGYIAK